MEKIGSNKDDICERFFIYMDDTNKEVMYTLAVLGEWSDEELDSILNYILHIIRDKIKGYSFIYSEDNGIYKLDTTIKDILVETCPKSIVRMVNKYLENELSKDIDPLDSVYVRLLTKYINNHLIMGLSGDELLEFYTEKAFKLIKKLEDRFEYEEMSIIIESIIFEKNTKLSRPNVNNSLRARLYLDYSKALTMDEKYEEAIKYAIEANESYVKLLGKENRETIDSMKNLAILHYLKFNEYEAMNIEIEILELNKKISNEENEIGLISMVKKAESYMNNRELEKACKIIEEILYKGTETLGKYHPFMKKIMKRFWITFNLSINDSPDLMKQRIIYIGEKLLDYNKSVNGEGHIETIKAMTDLAASYAMIQNHEEAIRLGLQALKLCEITLEESEKLIVMKLLFQSYDYLNEDKEANDYAKNICDYFLRYTKYNIDSTNRKAAKHDLEQYLCNLTIEDEINDNAKKLWDTYFENFYEDYSNNEKGIDIVRSVIKGINCRKERLERYLDSKNILPILAEEKHKLEKEIIIRLKNEKLVERYNKMYSYVPTVNWLKDKM